MTSRKLDRATLEHEVQEAYRAFPVKVFHHSENKMSANSLPNVHAARNRFVELMNRTPASGEIERLLMTVHMTRGSIPPMSPH